MSTRTEIAVFVTRSNGSEVLVVHRSPVQGAYWHVVAGGIEAGEDAATAARRELLEETGLVAPVSEGPQVVERVFKLTKEPAEWRPSHSPSIAEVTVWCFRCDAPEGWCPMLDWEHDDYRWCTPNEAAATLRWPETARALRKMLGSEDGL